MTPYFGDGTLERIGCCYYIEVSVHLETEPLRVVLSLKKADNTPNGNVSSNGYFVMQSAKRFGLSCALALPLTKQFDIDYVRLKAHASRCLQAGCSSVTVFGTTGEGASVSLAERKQILDALSAAGIDLHHQVLGGVAASAVGDAVQQARVLIDRGCRGVLLAPPFYFKNVTDEGLYGWFSQVFEALGHRAPDIILYHIPSVTEVALSVSLLGRLKTAFPNIVKGVKDSGDNWAYTEKLLKTHHDLLILIGNERHLAAGIRLGAQGAISGLANVFPDILIKLIETGEDDSQVAALATEILAFPVAPAVKALLAHRHNDPAWLTVRPPLERLSAAEAARLAHAYNAIVC